MVDGKKEKWGPYQTRHTVDLEFASRPTTITVLWYLGTKLASPPRHITTTSYSVRITGHHLTCRTSIFD